MPGGCRFRFRVAQMPQAPAAHPLRTAPSLGRERNIVRCSTGSSALTYLLDGNGSVTYIPLVYPSEAIMARSTVFTTNRSQAVRLPKPVALPAAVRQVEITKVGRSRIISPADQSWDSFFDGPRVSDDFMAERRQPIVEERERL